MSDEEMIDRTLKNLTAFNSVIRGRLEKLISYEAENAALRADKEILDWCDRVNADFQWHDGDPSVGAACGYEVRWGEGKSFAAIYSTFRQAAVAAMQAEKSNP